MSVIKPRFWPRLKLYRRNATTRPAMLRDIISDAIEVQTTVEPARRSALNVVPLDDGKAVVTLDYKQKWQNTPPNKWVRYPDPQEQLYRQNSIALMQEQLSEELAKEQNDQDIKLIASLRTWIKDLSDNGTGFLEEAGNIMGANVKASYWSLAAPNVPVTLISTFKLSKNRSFSIRLQRSQAPVGQAKHNFRIEFGTGFTLYAIEIGSDGNKSTFYHYRNMKPKDRKVLLDEMDDLLDYDRLTPPEMAKIIDLHQQAADIKNGALGRQLTQDENDKLKAISDEEKALRDSKGLLPSQSQRINDLENQLYLAKKQFKLQEDAQDLINKTVDITVQFLRGGYVVIQSADSRFVYENQRLTGWRPRGYHDGLPDKSKIHIKSDGGQFAVIYGNPDYAREAVIATQQFPLNVAPVLGDLNVEEDADYSAPGCNISYTVKELQAPLSDIVERPGFYQAIINMQSDGTYTPELYRAQLHIPAAPVAAPEQVWDSQVEGKNLNANSGNYIIDAILHDDSARARSVDVHLDNAFSKCNLPTVLGGLAADIYLYDRQEEKDVYLLTQGRIISSVQNDQRNLESDPNIECGGELVITVIGVESFLDKEITARITGDGKYPNDYIRELAIDGGLTDDEISGIPSGYMGIPKIERGIVGEEPAVQPADGARYWSWIKDVVRNHCYGYELYNDGTALQLKSINERFNEDLSYALPPDVTVDSKLCLRGELSVKQELSGYVTKVTVIGSKDPLRGERFTHTESFPQAKDTRHKNSAYYTGIEVTEVLPVDDSLTSEKACQFVARRTLGVTPVTPHGFTSWYINGTVDFDSAVIAGDVVRVFGKKCVIDSIDFGSLAADQDAEKMKVQFRLAEDWTE